MRKKWDRAWRKGKEQKPERKRFFAVKKDQTRRLQKKSQPCAACPRQNGAKPDRHGGNAKEKPMAARKRGIKRTVQRKRKTEQKINAKDVRIAKRACNTHGNVRKA